MTTISDQIPHQCLEYDKFYRSRPILQCPVCRDLKLVEGIFCDLNRAVQDNLHFVCHAFRPGLKLVGPAGKAKLNQRPAIMDPKKRHKSIQEIMASDKYKYQKALALQKLSRYPDEFFVELKYHLAWNVRHRKPVLVQEKKYVDFVLDTLAGCGDLVGGAVRLIWLAPDHLHLYLDSDGEKSIDSIIRKLKALLNKTILGEFPMIKNGLGKGRNLWDKAYFSETLG
jgi:REP element-mobilizing transposase RayT